jgi:hypothetical protein
MMNLAIPFEFVSYYIPAEFSALELLDQKGLETKKAAYVEAEILYMRDYHSLLNNNKLAADLGLSCFGDLCRQNFAHICEVRGMIQACLQHLDTRFPKWFMD